MLTPILIGSDYGPRPATRTTCPWNDGGNGIRKVLHGGGAILRLKPGHYFGEQTAQRATDGIVLTLCHYPPNENLPSHSHAYPGFFFLLSGQHRESNRLGEADQPECSMIYHEAGDEHSTKIGPKGMTGLNIAFRNEWLAAKQVDRFAERNGACENKPWSRTSGIALLAGMRSESIEVLESIALELVASTEVGPVSIDKQTPAWLSRTRSKIEEEFDSPLSLSSLAAEAAVHPVYLARAFRETYRCSVTDYIQETRLARAFSNVLTGMSVGEAAANCGFCDQAYFTRLAKSRFGTTPSDLIRFRSSKRSIYPAA